MNGEALEWDALDRLREGFLGGAAAAGPYWQSRGDLAVYDATYGERIGWKWDAVLRELRLRGWTPPVGAAVLDWGCGSGVAGRRVVRCFGTENFSALQLHDRSALAVDFAGEAARAAFPHLPVEAWRDQGNPASLLVVSHVLNELAAHDRGRLLELARRATAVLWVEPGTHADSRALQQIREELRGEFRVVAPCTHQAACGLLAADRGQDWCHHFAPPPPEIFADSGWVKFGRRAGIDLRSLPYSFLVLDRRARADAPAADFSRIVGRPEHFKAFARFLNCDAGGIVELTLQKRDDPVLFKQLDRTSGPLLYRWRRDGDRVSGGERLAAEPRT